MLKNQTKKNIFKVLVCSLVVTVFSSFEKCDFTEEQINHFCTPSYVWECTLTWTGGPCTGQGTTFSYMRPL